MVKGGRDMRRDVRSRQGPDHGGLCRARSLNFVVKWRKPVEGFKQRSEVILPTFFKSLCLFCGEWILGTQG